MGREMTDDEADDHRKTHGRKESDRRMGWPYPPRPEPISDADAEREKRVQDFCMSRGGHA